MDRGRKTIILISRCPAETFRIGRSIGEHLNPGDCLALTGELGAGKTRLTQGIAQGLGVPESYAVTSPTFTLLNEYPGTRTALYHLDVYRLAGSADLLETGFEEYLTREGVTVIEWADKIADQIPEDALHIALSIVEEDVRSIAISGPPMLIDSCEAHLRERGYRVSAHAGEAPLGRQRLGTGRGSAQNDP